jgi:porphobilinogen synthase
MHFPQLRLRRLRKNERIRRLVRETNLLTNDFIYPLFVCPGKDVKNPISSMVGQFQLSVDHVIKEVLSNGRSGGSKKSFRTSW